MENRKFWMGMLAVALVFTMTVVGCEDEPTYNIETNPSPPTGLTGNAVSSSSIRLNWNAASNADVYLIQYKKTQQSDVFYLSAGGDIKTTSYTFTNLEGLTKYDFRVAVRNKDYYVSDYSSPITVETLNYENTKVSVDIETKVNYNLIVPGQYYYSINITLSLSDGAYWKSDLDNSTYSPAYNETVKSWITMSGTPNVSSWKFGWATSISAHSIGINYSQSSSSPVSISGLTATLNTSKLAEMKSYTNATNNFSADSPSSVSSSTWRNY